MVAAALVLTPSAATADAVKFSGFWIDNAVVLDVRDGQLVFRSRGGEVRRPLSQIEGLRLDGYPALERGAERLAAGDATAALAAFEEVVAEARASWLQAYALGRVVDAGLAAERGVVAIRAWTRLVSMDVDDALVIEPPVRAAAMISDDEAPAMVEALERARSRVGQSRGEAVRAMLEPLRALAGGGDAAAVLAAAEDGAAADRAAVVLPAVLDEDDPISARLLAGEFEQAEADARVALTSTGGTSRELFQLGMALLGQAEASGDPDEFKTAALAFMRVPIHFAGGSRLTDYALVEAAYCHHRFGRDDLAADLLDRARNAITESDDPAYSTRIDRVLAEIRGETP